MKKIIKIIFIISIIFFLYNCYLKKEKISLVNNLPLSIFQIQSGSMIPNIEIGEIIVLLKCKNYQEKDIITYKLNSYFITHRIIEVTENGYITKGDFNNTKDEKIVKQEQIQGKVIFHSKILGKIVKYRFYIIGILIFFLLLEIRKEKTCHKK